MSRTTETITFSLPPKMARTLEDLREKQGRTRSGLLREALRKYIEIQEWEQVFKYGAQKAREKGITRAKVEALVDETRK